MVPSDWSRLRQTLLVVSVAYGQGRIKGVEWGACILPLSIFKNVFRVHNFYLISNLFDSDKPYLRLKHA